MRRIGQCQYCENPATCQMSIGGFKVQACREHVDRALDEYLEGRK